MLNRKPWQKTFRKLPISISARLGKLDSQQMIVAALKSLKYNDIRDGLYEHLGIEFQGDEVAWPKSVIPVAVVGRASSYNLNGKEIVRKDLPKETKTFSFEAPNFGDFTKGTHDVSFTKDCYQRELMPPKGNAILIERLSNDGDSIIFKFQVEEIHDRHAVNFEEDLLRNINLLQENTGVCDVFPVDAPDIDYLSSIQVEWEILPPGIDDREMNIQKIIAGRQSGIDVEVVRERLDVIESLNPRNLIKGTSGFHRYFGAQYEDNLVAFENISYGNALYVMFDDWRTLSKRSRLELLKSQSDGYVRIIHRQGWKKSLARVVNQYRAEHGL